ncbi:MAG: alpha/beta fold hydrolase [Ignavibacteriae bacterium]|nr:MAG: alpha/beta fold hydrolase [Ignavibacteriota bacterium]
MKTLLNDSTINYHEHGMPQGLPVVFIHGFPFSSEMWVPQINVMPNNIHAIAYDVRGHGASDTGDGQYTLEIFVDDLIALLDHLSIEKAFLCGLSMGGYIALRTYERHPERVRGLILCDTKCEPDTDSVKIKRSATIKSIKSTGVPAFAEEFVKSVFWEKTIERNPNVITFIKQIIGANSPRGICGTLLALASRTDTTPALSSIHVPTCIMVGEHDTVTPPSDAERMHAAIPGSELHILPHAAHMSNLENAEEFNEFLTVFLRKS